MPKHAKDLTLRASLRTEKPRTTRLKSYPAVNEVVLQTVTKRPNPFGEGEIEMLGPLVTFPFGTAEEAKRFFDSL